MSKDSSTTPNTTPATGSNSSDPSTSSTPSASPLGGATPTQSIHPSLNDLPSAVKEPSQATPDVERPHTADEVAAPAQPPQPAKRGRVRFNSKSEVRGEGQQRFKFPLADVPISVPDLHPPQPSASKDNGQGKSPIRDDSGSDSSNRKGKDSVTPPKDPFTDSASQSRTASVSSVNKPELLAPAPKRPRPSVLRTSSANSFTGDMLYTEPPGDERSMALDHSARKAHERAQKVATAVKTSDLPLRNFGDKKADDSPVPGFARMPARGYGDKNRSPGISSPLSAEQKPEIELNDIPLIDLGKDGKAGGYLPALSSDEDADLDDEEKAKKRDRRQEKSSTAEAHKLVRSHTQRKVNESMISLPRSDSPGLGLESGPATPTEERDYAEEYVARPEQYRGGVLSSLLKLYNQPNESTPKHRRYSSLGGQSGFSTPGGGSSGTSTPKVKTPKWYNQKNHSTNTLANLVEASSALAAHATANSSKGGAAGSSGESSKDGKPKRPGMHSRTHSGGFEKVYDKLRRPRLEDEIRITVHIAETLARQRYLVRLCRALMAYGAPTHRLEEYMRMSARVLEMDVQVLYIPGCMLISFDDASTHTTEVKLVRTNQGINLGKLKDVHEIYKEVVHDVIGVEEATQRLDAIIREKQRFHKWLLVPVYGLASACVGPFAFESNFIDLPIAFILGCCLGFLQLIVAPKSDLYANVFEISAAVVTSFLARAFGSIMHNGERLFCFSALAQSSIALILPGYIILCGSLELQSKSIVAGSVRMFYAVIYSLFLGFGITIGTALYGVMDHNAVSSTTCKAPMPVYLRLIFVPCFTMCLAIINQAKFEQTPMMLLISFTGYIVNFFTARRFPSSPQVSQTLGAFTVGVMGNMYSRLRHGVAAAALLPAIFVQVPSGLAAGGSLLSGLTSANDITSRNSTTNSTGAIEVSQVSPDPGVRQNSTGKVAISVLIGMMGQHELWKDGDPEAKSQSVAEMNSIVFNVGYSMIQVAIGITVGLFLSALVVYPLGKRRSGLFSF